jgi:transcriptional regulator with XRE-family HTH domain
MRLEDVLRKERERKQLSVQDVASSLGISVDAYSSLETGDPSIEQWGLQLSQFAIKLKTPTSRLISETGRSAQANLEDGQCGKLLRKHRNQQGLSQEELAESVGMPVTELMAIENGQSPLEHVAPLLLRFAELIEQPIFNLFYPCGLPLDKLDDYP